MALVVNDLTCPISLEIFDEPVICEDGITYENDEILKLFGDKKSIISPVTRKPIKKSIMIVNFAMKNVIAKFLADHPEYSRMCYKSLIFEYTFNFMNDNNITQIDASLGEELIDIKKYDHCELTKIITDLSLEKLKYIVDHTKTITKSFINLLVDLKNVEMTIYAMDKLKIIDNNRHRNIIINACMNSTELINILIENDYETSKHNLLLIHYVCKYGNEKTIHKILSKNIHLNAQTKTGWTPLHFLCKRNMKSSISYLLSKNVSVIKTTQNNIYAIEFLNKYLLKRFALLFNKKGLSSRTIINGTLLLKYFS